MLRVILLSLTIVLALSLHSNQKRKTWLLTSAMPQYFELKGRPELKVGISHVHEGFKNTKEAADAIQARWITAYTWNGRFFPWDRRRQIYEGTFLVKDSCITSKGYVVLICDIGCWITVNAKRPSPVLPEIDTFQSPYSPDNPDVTGWTNRQIFEFDILCGINKVTVILDNEIKPLISDNSMDPYGFAVSVWTDNSQCQLCPIGHHCGCYSPVPRELKTISNSDTHNTSIVNFISRDRSARNKRPNNFEVTVSEYRQKRNRLPWWQGIQWLTPANHIWNYGEKFVFEHKFVADCVSADVRVIVHSFGGGFKIWANGQRTRVYDHSRRTWKHALSGGMLDDGRGMSHDRFVFTPKCGQNVINIQVDRNRKEEHPALVYNVFQDVSSCYYCPAGRSWNKVTCKCPKTS